MADKKISWAAWGWLTLLGLMLVIPVLGVVIDQASAVGTVLLPIFSGAVLGIATLLAALYLKNVPWWWAATLAAWTVTVVLFHRQMGLLLTGALIGCVAGFFREWLLQAGRRGLAWYLSRRKASKLD